MRIRNQKDVWAGILFVGFGAFFTGMARQYELGEAANMGAGYFPTLLGILLTLLGLIVVAGGMSPNAASDRVARFSWRTLIFVLGPVGLFGILLNSLGLVLAIASLIIIASYASHEFRLREALTNAVVLTALSLLVFLWGLNLPFQLWPAFGG